MRKFYLGNSKNIKMINLPKKLNLITITFFSLVDIFQIVNCNRNSKPSTVNSRFVGKMLILLFFLSVFMERMES